MAVACVDAGTTVVKAVCFDDEGRALSVARTRMRVERQREGQSEQDMERVFAAVISTVRSAAREGGEPVTMISLTGQGDGCWLVDRDGRPTGPAILWNDARAAEIVERWSEDGVLDAAYRINGSLTFPGTVAAILAWLHEHDDLRLAAAHKALHCGGWLFHELTGELAVEQSDAASPFMDIRTRQYADSLLTMYGMPWAERLLPEIRGPGVRIGLLGARVAEELGCRPGLPVVMAPFDIPATAIGVGATEPGQACTILGTTLSTELVVDAPDTAGAACGMTVPSGLGERFVRAVAAMAGTEVVQWSVALLGLDGPAKLSELAAQSTPGSGGLFVHPYLSPAGERAPIRTPLARGSVSGLSLEHTRSDVARAVLEGLSLVVRDCLRSMARPVSELRLCGGGAGSAFWCQLLADVTGVPTTRPEEPELGARGAFIAALVETGAAGSAAEALALGTAPSRRCEPDAATAALYDQSFEDFLAIRERLEGTWPRLDAAKRRGTGR